MIPDATSLAAYRTTLDAGFYWNMVDADDRWRLDVRVPAQIHADGLLVVEDAIEQLMFALQFAVDLSYGDPVTA